MTGKELFAIMARGDMPPRIPFVPSIYEHSARVIDETPSRVARDEDLIVKSQLACYELYRHDLISVGVDIYNIECEALGAEVQFFEDQKIPAVNEVLVDQPQHLKELVVPAPENDGRMPLFLRAVERINNEVGEEVIVNGTVVGPFTLAALLRGFENFIMDLMENRKFALELLDFSLQVGLEFARAFSERGVGVSINESWISPPLLSPTLYRECVYPYEKEMIGKLNDMGMENVALISGGDTTAIADYMVKTGTSLLMADYNTDQEYYKNVCAENNILLRASINAGMVEEGDENKLRGAVKKVLENCADYEKFIFGCGVVSYDTTAENVLLLKKIVQELDNRKSLKK